MTFTPLPHYNGAKAHGRDRTALSAMKAEIEHAGGKAMSVLADVTKSTEIQTMRHQIKHIFGRIDILVANAGASFSRPGPIGQISEEGRHAFVGSNLAATFLTIKSFLPGIKERKAGNSRALASAFAHMSMRLSGLGLVMLEFLFWTGDL